MRYKINKRNYHELVSRIKNLEYSSVTSPQQMNIQQTINFFIYQFRIALGEITITQKKGILQNVFARRNKIKDQSQEFKGHLYFSNKLYNAKNFSDDKSLLLSKMQKSIQRPETHCWQSHPVAGHLTKHDYLYYLFNMIHEQINFFEKQFSDQLSDN